jgi:hypothetical protein
VGYLLANQYLRPPIWECNVQVGQIEVGQIQYWSYAKIIFPAGFAGQGVLNKHPTVRIDDRYKLAW